MPSKLSTVRRFAHAEITESESFGTGFAFFEAAVVHVVVFLGFFTILVFFFLGFKSSSSDSTLRGISLTWQHHNKNRIWSVDQSLDLFAILNAFWVIFGIMKKLKEFIFGIPSYKYLNPLACRRLSPKNLRLKGPDSLD